MDKVGATYCESCVGSLSTEGSTTCDLPCPAGFECYDGRMRECWAGTYSDNGSCWACD